MGTPRPRPRAPRYMTKKLRRVRDDIGTLRNTVDQLNRFVDAVARIAPDIAERAALAVE